VFLIFSAIGCTPSQTIPEPEQPEPNQAQTTLWQTEPNVTETEPNITKTEPDIAEPNIFEPNIPEPNLEEPNIAQVNISDVNVAQANERPPEVVEVNVAEVNRPAGPNESFYQEWAEVLKEYVTNEGNVKYELLDHRKMMLDKLLKRFAKLQRGKYNSWRKEDKLALWINVYNIQMLKVITDNYPIDSKRIHRIFYWPPESIRHIVPTNVIGVKKWDRYKLIVMNEEFTLSEIEKNIFRKRFDEPRFLFALTYATLSSAPMRNEPYYGDKLSDQLDDQVKRFLTNPKAFKINREKRQVHLSAVFDPKWYGKDFISKYGTDKRFKKHPPAVRAVLNFITKYLPEEKAVSLEEKTFSVQYINYDWRLNEASGR